MLKTFNFLAPSLHPNTLADVSIAQPGLSAPDPIVRNLAIRYGAHQAVGTVKMLADRGNGHVVVADDQFKVSVIALNTDQDGKQRPPEVVKQVQTKGKTNGTWAGLAGVQAGTIAALHTGTLTLIPSPDSLLADYPTTKVLDPITCIASSGPSSTQVAMAGKNVDLCIYDVERLFASDRVNASRKLGAKGNTRGLMKEWNPLEDGEVWRAKNLPNTSLNLRVPIHHRCIIYHPTTHSSLYTGTKMGTVRHYDTRQRKPISDWALAREGGIGAISFSSMSSNEIFFADHSSLLGALDIRTGKMLYGISSPVSTHSITCFPSIPQSDPTIARQLGMAAICSDASLRLYATTPAPEEGVKGNWGAGKKGVMAGLAGGVGVGGFLWRGYGEVEEVRQEGEGGKGAKGGKGGEGEDEEDEDAEGDEEVWEGMDEVADGDEDGEDSWDEDSDDEPPAKKSKTAGAARTAGKASIGKSGKAGKGGKGVRR